MLFTFPSSPTKSLVSLCPSTNNLLTRSKPLEPIICDPLERRANRASIVTDQSQQDPRDVLSNILSTSPQGYITDSSSRKIKQEMDDRLSRMEQGMSSWTSRVQHKQLHGDMNSIMEVTEARQNFGLPAVNSWACLLDSPSASTIPVAESSPHLHLISPSYPEASYLRPTRDVDHLQSLCLQLPRSYRNPRSRNTFKPNKATSGKGSSSWQLRKFAEATLGGNSLRKAVKLPEREDVNEWLAVNIVDFYNQINLLYGSITEFCSPQTCPEMKATDEFEYLWQDSEQFKRPTKMPAPEYIEHLMTWCQNNIDNEQMFPSRIGVSFPKAFPGLVRTMFKRLYRVYAHIYCHHYPVVLQLGLEPHLNTSFKHYVLFVDEHQLAQGKDFWGPLGELVDSMLRSD